MLFIARRVFWSATQRFASIDIRDVLFFESLLQGILVELGIEAAEGRAAYIHQDFDAVTDEQLDEFINGMPAVSYRIQVHCDAYPLANPTAAWKAK